MGRGGISFDGVGCFEGMFLWETQRCFNSLPQKHRNFPCRSPSEFCIFHEWSLFWAFFSTSLLCSDVEVSFFFYAPISNVYVFEFLVLRHSNVQFKWIFYAQRKWKIVPVNGWSHLFESQLNEVFEAAEGAASSGDM